MKTIIYLTVMIFTVFAISSANAALVQFSLDGNEPTPESIDVFPGDNFTMYVISDSNEPYGRSLIVKNIDPVSISNVQSYPAAGDLADIDPFIGSLFSGFKLMANDSAGNILAGRHFSFDLAIAPDAQIGEQTYIDLILPSIGEVLILNVIPEPATVLLLSFGGILFYRKRV